VAAMRAPNSGLEIKRRQWLCVQIDDAFVGSEAVDWILERVEDLADRKDAKKIMTQMQKNGFITHKVNKSGFSESCYYSFVDPSSITPAMAGMSLKGEGVAAAGSNASSGHGSGNARQPLLPAQGATSLPPPTVPAPPLPHTHHFGPPPMQLAPPAYPQPQYGEHSIYNPTAPPPSAAYGGFMAPLPQHSSGGDSGGGGNGGARLRLAGSGSGSESGVAGPVVGGGPGSAGGSTVGSDGGFRARLLHQQEQGEMLLL